MLQWLGHLISSRPAQARPAFQRPSRHALAIAQGGVGLMLTLGHADAQSADALAKSVANPLAAMISLPFQFNTDFGAGSNGDGVSDLLKFQPVIPFRLDKNWNVISRTVAPLSFAHNIFSGDRFGLGDVSESLFLSPTPSGGVTVGFGPQFSLPLATDPAFGSGKLGLGPTGIVVVQQDKLTYGMLASQTWSIAGDSHRPDVSQLYLQPFLAYALGGGQTLTASLEASYDWYASQWSVPLNLTYSKVFTVGQQPMSWQVGLRKYLASPADGPSWGIRTGLTFLFPEH